MARGKKEKNLDVDLTTPHQHRVRNILTLEERVRAIHAYDEQPMYTKIAKQFNCGWEQIKNIISNREAILSFHDATKNSERNIDANNDEMRQRKIDFLGECIYEYMQRAQFHMKVDINEELIRMKATEFLEVMGIEKFTPNRAWINHFKATYNFSLSNRQIKITHTPASSLDLKDIMTYCTKYKTKTKTIALPRIDAGNLHRATTQIAISNANDATLEEFRQKHTRKVNFLENALLEYVFRSHYHHKIDITDTVLRQKAKELKKVLKIDYFQPSLAWCVGFRNRHKINDTFNAINVDRTPPLSLDLLDILSYCSRREQKIQEHYVQLETNSQSTNSSSSSIQVRSADNLQIKEEIIDLDESDVEDIKPNLATLNTLLAAHNNESDNSCQSTAAKVQKIDCCSDATQSPVSWLESNAANEILPQIVRNNADALKLLKPVEDFAFIEQNYQVMDLLAQLKEILTKSNNKKIKK